MSKTTDQALLEDKNWIDAWIKIRKYLLFSTPKVNPKISLEIDFNDTERVYTVVIFLGNCASNTFERRYTLAGTATSFDILEYAVLILNYIVSTIHGYVYD